MNVECYQGHHRRANIEEVATGVTRCHRLDSAVITGRGCRPCGDRSTITCVVSECHVSRSIKHHRTFQILDRDSERFTAGVTVDILREVDHFSGAYCERIAR